MNIKTKCKKCGVWVSDLGRHLERKRCEAVENRRLFRKENKASKSSTGNLSGSIGVRGQRTDIRNGVNKEKKQRSVLK